VECWLRHIDYVAGIVAECQAGVVRHDLVTWTVMGFYNHCTLSDLKNMVLIDDPYSLLARWKSQVVEYPPKLRAAIIAQYLGAAKFWPDNFHYKSAIERGDLIYVMGIVQQVVHNIIQVVFALNNTYFPGDKKLDSAIAHLPMKPQRFVARIKQLLWPGVPADKRLLVSQREELVRLLGEIDELVAQAQALAQAH
jgi:hypothetical protein